MFLAGKTCGKGLLFQEVIFGAVSKVDTKIGIEEITAKESEPSSQRRLSRKACRTDITLIEFERFFSEKKERNLSPQILCISRGFFHFTFRSCD